MLHDEEALHPVLRAVVAGDLGRRVRGQREEQEEQEREPAQQADPPEGDRHHALAAQFGVLLLRRPGVAGVEEVVQGIWVDWPKLKKSMLDQVKDLVPDEISDVRLFEATLYGHLVGG